MREDVECNPGPSTVDMFNEIMESQNAIQRKIGDLQAQQLSTVNLIGDLSRWYIYMECLLQEIRVKTTAIDEF